MAKSNERQPIVTVIPVGTRATSIAISVPGIYFRKRSRIKSVTYIDTTAQPASGTNWVSLALQTSAAVVYASLNSSPGLAAVTPLAFTLASDDGDSGGGTAHPEKDVPAGTTLNLLLGGNGTGVFTNAAVCVEWYPV